MFDVEKESRAKKDMTTMLPRVQIVPLMSGVSCRVYFQLHLVRSLALLHDHVCVDDPRVAGLVRGLPIVLLVLRFHEDPRPCNATGEPYNPKPYKLNPKP